MFLGLFDVNEDGHIDMAEFGDLVKYLRNWKGTFGTFVKSKVMGINATQLYTTLKVITLLSVVTNTTFNSVQSKSTQFGCLKLLDHK